MVEFALLVPLLFLLAIIGTPIFILVDRKKRRSAPPARTTIGTIQRCDRYAAPARGSPMNGLCAMRTAVLLRAHAVRTSTIGYPRCMSHECA